MKLNRTLIVSVFVVASCGLAYELIMAALASYLLGDSILQFPNPIPFLGWTDLRILPIVYVISQMVFGKITQTPTSDQQQNSTIKIMMYGMPLFFFFMFYNAPAGLLLYWTCTNFLMLVQQMIIKAMMKKKEVRK